MYVRYVLMSAHIGGWYIDFRKTDMSEKNNRYIWYVTYYHWGNRMTLTLMDC